MTAAVAESWLAALPVGSRVTSRNGLTVAVGQSPCCPGYFVQIQGPRSHKGHPSLSLDDLAFIAESIQAYVAEIGGGSGG